MQSGLLKREFQSISIYYQGYSSILMRVLFCILFLLLQGGVLSFPGLLNADSAYSAHVAVCEDTPSDKKEIISGEDITAPWERSSEAAIRGDRILSDLYSNKKKSLAMDAFCSPESLEKLNSLRTSAADILSRDSVSGKTRNEILLAGVILLKLEEVSITSLTADETELVRRSEKITLCDYNFSGTGFLPGVLPVPEYAVSPSVIPFSFSASNTIKRYPLNKKEIYAVLKHEPCDNNIFDGDFIDLYRLFLYVRDNSGNRKKIYQSYNNAQSHAHSTLCNLTRYITASTFKNTIQKSGAVS